MVFLTGPRQVGKTWLSKEIQKRFSSSVYLNYDSLEDRQIIIGKQWMPNTELLVLDELHKMPLWKNYLKGLFDTKSEQLKILVTGSARLEAFRQMGDSLAGRYFRHRLLPISLAELNATSATLDIEKLESRGGFPEPFLAKSEVNSRRWRNQYIDGLIRTDILDFEKIHDFKSIQMVLDILRRRVGSPVSFLSIARDVGVSPNTVKKYIEIFESLYIVFRVTPFSKNIARSLLKEPKIYFFDNGMVKGDEGAKFENLVAISLLKHCYGLQDYEASDTQLYYLRNKEKKEVDFCLVVDQEASLMLEVKLSSQTLNKSIWDFYNKYKISGIQILKYCSQEKIEGGIEIRDANKYLASLYM